MTAANDDSTTDSELSAGDRGRSDLPVLLVGSHVPLSSRVVVLDGTATFGRGPSPDRDGRNRGEDVILHSDGALSRRHLRIVEKERGWQVEDLGSRNGTFADGVQVKRPMSVADGMVLQFGSFAGVFRRVSDDALMAIEREAAHPFGPVPTMSPTLAMTLATVRRLAAIDDGAHLLFIGETGVGKEVYARAVHAASKRRGPFIAVNCAALPADLVESELFGYARGAHSTATRAKPGLVELADGGTLLLDEIGDMAPQAQAKLFRFLQDRKVLALGSTRARPVDVRVVAATSKLAETVRSDLIGRFGAEPIVLPALRERLEDVGALAAHFGGRALAAFGGIEPAAFRALCLYHWPRNVRELEEVVKRAVALAVGRPVRLTDLPAHVQASLQSGRRIATDPRTYRSGPGRDKLERLMREKRGNIAAVARALGRHWNVVQRWLRKSGLEADRFRE